MKLTQKQIDDYLKNPDHCPNCGQDEELEGGKIQADSNYAWQEIECPACGFSWQDVYTLTGIDSKE